MELSLALEAAGLPRDPAPLGPDDPRPRAPARSCSRRSRTPGSTGRSWSAATPRSRATFPDGLSLLRAMADLGGVPTRDRDPVLSAGPRGHPRRRAPPGPPRQGAVRRVHDDAAVLRPEGDRRVHRRAPRRRDHAAGEARHPGRRRGPEAHVDQRPDRRPRRRPVPHEEHPVRRAAAHAPAASTARRACSRSWRRSSPTRRRTSSTSTSTRSTRSPSTESWRARVPGRRSARRPPRPAPGPPRDRGSMTPGQRRLRDALAATPGRPRPPAATAAPCRPGPRRPHPGSGRAREVLLHLAAVEEEVWHARLDALATRRVPALAVDGARALVWARRLTPSRGRLPPSPNGEPRPSPASTRSTPTAGRAAAATTPTASSTSPRCSDRPGPRRRSTSRRSGAG